MIELHIVEELVIVHRLSSLHVEAPYSTELVRRVFYKQNTVCNARA